MSMPTPPPAGRRPATAIPVAAAVLLAALSVAATHADDDEPSIDGGGDRAERAPIALHPDNPHYFTWRGKPVILITSAEHYGAILNLDFDIERYLETLEAEGMNYTRVFTGAYVEPQGAFNIARNTLAPPAGRFLCPWARSDRPGYAKGGNKFDLSKWDEAWFERMKAFLEDASRRGIVVEVTLFCPMYEQAQWDLSPMNFENNVNGVGDIARTDVHTLDKNGALLAYQEAMVRKIVTELNAFDNVIYELCNEPYFGGVTLEWQHRIADLIVETERGLPHRHLIAQNIANKTAKIEDPHPAISVFNFHYATPPDAVATNFHLGKVIGDDETGFRGTGDEPYRIEAWEFLLAGGGLFNHLDYSFAPGFEGGTFDYPATQPGGGGPSFRKQLRILGDFLRGFDFVRMRPDDGVVRGGVPDGGSARALVEPGKAMAIYLRGDGAARLEVAVPDGEWSAAWLDTKSGETLGTADVAGGGTRGLEVPDYETDIALRLVRR